MKIIDKINNYLTNPHIPDKRGRFAHYPSEASIISRIDGSIIGKCHRASWYSWTGVQQTNLIDARGMWTVETGKKIEGSYIEYCKQLGIWAGNNIKFYNREHNISGEVDLFIFNEDAKIEGVEIKSAYGYGYQKSVTQFPKIENLLQTAIYIDHFDMLWHLIYKARDTQEDVEYIITKENDENGTYLIVNGIPVYIFYVQDIYMRYKELGEHVIKNEIPPRDYVYGFSPEQTVHRLDNGKISRSKYKNIKAGKCVDADWECVYCSYLNECWKDKIEIIRRESDNAESEHEYNDIGSK